MREHDLSVVVPTFIRCVGRTAHREEPVECIVLGRVRKEFAAGLFLEVVSFALDAACCLHCCLVQEGRRWG